MTRIRFEDLPSTNTPRNAENLNKLNNVAISPTEPTTGEEVWIQKGKNLVKSHSVGITSQWQASLYVDFDMKPNTTYTISFDSDLGRDYFYPNEYIFTNVNWKSTSGRLAVTVTSLGENILSDKSNLGYAILKNALELPSIPNFSNVQIEVGDTATQYEPYIDKKIYTKNDNGVYEEFYDETNLEVYSTEEQRIGTWIDGKPLYRKVIEFPNGLGAASGVTGNNFQLNEMGINNVEEIFVVHPSFYTLNNRRYPFAYNDGSYYDVSVEPSRLNIKITYEDIAKSRIVVTLEYTKTTD